MRDCNKQGWSEDILVELAQAGDGDAEEILIRKYKELVKAKTHLYFIIGADRDDIVQEGMIGIFKAIRNYDKTRQASFRTFAELCISRQILSAIKQATRRKHSPLNMSVSLNKEITNNDRILTLAETLASGSGSDPEELLLIKETIKKIGESRGKALSKFESAVWGMYLEGKTYKEIGASMEKSTKAVDNAIQRSKKKLASIIAGEQEVVI